MAVAAADGAAVLPDFPDSARQVSLYRQGVERPIRPMVL
jgi:hypothetical protein